MKKQFLYRLLPLLVLLAQANLAKAENPLTAGPGNGRFLAEVLNPDGIVRAGAPSSFDARAFSMHTAPDGRPVFRPAGVKGAGDERWADGFGTRWGRWDGKRRSAGGR